MSAAQLSIPSYNAGAQELPGHWPQELLRYGNVCRFERHAVLYHQGSYSTHVHLLLSGKVLRACQTMGGGESILEVHGCGDLLGLTAFLDGKSHPDSVRVLSGGTALTMPIELFRRFLAMNPGAQSILDSQLAVRQRHDSLLAVALANYSVEDRVRLLLCDLVARHGIHGDSRGTMLNLGLTRAEIASMVGACLETVIRNLNRLRDRDLLSFERRRFFIPDIDALNPQL